MKRFFATIVALFSISAFCVFAAEVNRYDFLHITKESSGLSYDGVRTALEDSRGFVWLGTYNGLCRFDGKRIVTYDHSDFGITSNYVASIEEDSEGNIWIGTDNGVVIYDFKNDSFSPLNSPLPLSNRVYSVKCVSNGDVWIAVRNFGLYRYQKSSGNITPVLRDESSPSCKMPYRIAQGLDSKVYFANYCDNVYCVSDSGEVVPVAESFFEGDDVEGLDIDEEGLMWVASKRHGLCRLNLHTGSVCVMASQRKDARATNVKCSGGYVWLSSTNGLIRFNPVNNESLELHNEPDNPFSISDDFVTSAFVSSTGVLWVTTDACGADFSNPDAEKFHKYSKLSDGSPLIGCVVKSFAQDSKGTIWIGTHSLGLMCLNPQTEQLCQYKAVGIPVTVNALASDGDFIWIGSNDGLCRLNVTTGKVKKYVNFFRNESENRIVSLFRTREEVLYCGTPIGVCRYNKVTDSFDAVRCLEGITVEDMAQDASGLLYLATYSQGAFAYDSSKDSIAASFCRSNGDSVISEMTSSLCVDSKGVPWIIGFGSGFYVREKDDFLAFSKESLPALTTDIFHSGEFDAEKNLWLSTDNGIVKFNPLTRETSIYSRNDGLLDDKFTTASLKLRDGRLVFGNENGFVIFDPSEDSFSSTRGELVISGLRINGERRRGSGNIDLAQKLVLQPDQRSLGFDFAVPGIVGTADVKIFCRLAGLEEEWSDISASGQVDYFNLKAGKYTLEFSRDNTKTSRTIELVLRPTFIESPYGIACIIFCAILVAFLISFFVYHNALAAQKKKHKDKEAAMKEQLYHEKMSFFANIIHEIKTPLTLIRTPLANLHIETESKDDRLEDLKIIENSTSYMEKLVKELLEFISLEEHGYVIERRNIDMTERLGFILSNYKELAKSRELKLNYKHNGPDVTCAVDGKALSKIVNNLLQNAMKFGETFAELELRTEGDKLKVFFRNDGKLIPANRRKDIFKPFVYFAEQESQSFGIGLPLARKLSELHGGSLVLSDRTDCNEFVLSLPLQTVPETESVEAEEIQEASSFQASNMPILLIVEDNADLLGYLKRKMHQDFKVVGVSSAEAALQKIQKNKVDLVITDIGLPNMDGVELCARISGNPQTAHIPIVVLSAISSLPTKVKCMENGASMYIEKPFSLDYLVSCVNSLMAKRKSMKNAYAPNTNAIVSVQAALPDRDSDFLKRLDEIISENIGDPTFSNTQIEQTLFVSHSSLNRKMRQLLNTTPNDYIRKKRLALAAQMLKRGGSRVSEICYAVGFNSPSYFAKCFREEFGVLPAEYGKGKNVASSGQ